MKKAQIGVLGLGNIGLCYATHLASYHSVIGIEISKEKVQNLQNKQLYISEPKLNDLFEKNFSNLSFSDCYADASSCDILIVCVGTPCHPNGTVNISQLNKLAKEIGSIIKETSDHKTILVRSTIPPRTTRDVFIPIIEKYSTKQHLSHFTVHFYPEFLREGSAISDIQNPAFSIIGSADTTASTQDIEHILKIENAIHTTFQEAEMLKYLCNSFHALKVAFTNEISSIAHSYGINSTTLFQLFCQDKKLNISEAYFRPGFSFGGPCLDKDLNGLTGLAKDARIEAPIVNSVLASNQAHMLRYMNILEDEKFKHILFTGICFKRNTDDFRKSPILSMLSQLEKAPSYLTKSITVFERPGVIDRLPPFQKTSFISKYNQKDMIVDLLVVGPLFDSQLLSQIPKKCSILNLGFYDDDCFTGFNLLKVV